MKHCNRYSVIRRLVVLLLLATAPAAFAAKRRAVVSPVPPPELAVPAADSIAAAAIAGGVPGVSIAVRKGDLTFARAYGLFDREAGIPVHTDTVFSIGSVTKQFTAAAILRLEDQGKLSITDKARKFLPELDARFDAITIRHLLQHTCGLRDDWIGQLSNITDPKTQQEIFAMITRSAPEFPAGSRFEYSNSGYLLLGMIIERASAQTWAQYVRDTFFTPMGLRNTSYCGETAPAPRGYTASPGGPVTLDSVVHPSLTWAAGAICSTASDLVRWNTSLVASPLHARMIAEGFPAIPGASYGFGLIIDTFEGRVRVWHSGTVPGFTTYLLWFPEEKLSVAVMMNINTDRDDYADDAADAIARSLFVQH